MEVTANKSSDRARSINSTSAVMKALLITDDWLQIELIKTVLPENEFEVHVLNSGSEYNAGSYAVPDLILADWDDYSIDGRAITLMLKKRHYDLTNVPSILITSRMVTLTRELAGTFSWILEKPIVTTSLPKLLRWTVKSCNARNHLRAFIQHGSTASGAMLATE